METDQEKAKKSWGEHDSTVEYAARKKIPEKTWKNRVKLSRSSVRAKSDCIVVFMWHFRDRSEETSDPPCYNCSQDTSIYISKHPDQTLRRPTWRLHFKTLNSNRCKDKRHSCQHQGQSLVVAQQGQSQIVLLLSCCISEIVFKKKWYSLWHLF